MKKTSKTIVFFGNERIATGVTTKAPTLQKLINSGYKLAAVVVNNESTRSRSTRKLEVAEIAAKHAIPVLFPDKLSTIKEQLLSYKAEAGVLVAYGKIVPQSVIDLFPRGIVNIHPSLLPLHRGPTPLESVIRQGDSKTGVSLMQLAKAMDAGPIYTQKMVSLQGNETKQELADRLLAIGSDMLLEHLDAIMEGNIQPVPQDHEKATYDTLIAKQDGIIDWSKPAVQIEREVRAFALWPKSRISFGKLDVIILKCRVISQKQSPGTKSIINKQPVIFCGDGQGLALEKVQLAGKKEITGEAFLAGYKDLFSKSD